MSEHDPHEPLWRWSATELAEAIRARRVSSVEVTTSFLDRIAETNDVINAIVGLDPADALAQAGSADRALVANASVGPLHGVPTSIKLNVDQRGRATTHGVTALADKIAENDAPLVANVREAGGILLGGTNLPAFSLRWFSGNDLHGKTLNPWNHDRTPGGSSGGAAAVSAGMLPIAHGNDIGGSVRYPAFVCGVAGIRPTSSADLNWLARAGAGYVPPEDDSLAGQLLAVEGWMARSTRDLRLGLAAMSPPETRLAYRLTEQATGHTHPLHVGVVRDIGLGAPHPSVDAAIDDAVACLLDAGYKIKEIEFPILREAYPLWNFLIFEEMRATMPTILEHADDTVRANMLATLEVTERMWDPRPP